MTTGMTRWGACAVVYLGACTQEVRVADDAGLGTGDAPVDSTGAGGPNGDTATSASITGSSSAAESSEADGGIKLDVPNGETDGGPLPVGCIGGNDLVWVLALDEAHNRQPELHRFDPDDPGFELVAEMECLPLKNVGDNPLSFAVGRDGRAVLALDLFEGIEQGAYLFSFDLFAPDPCATVAMDHWSPPAQGNSLALTALDPDIPDEESMFAHTNVTETFGEVRFDLPIIAVDYIGPSPFHFMTLTGTGDGRLYALGGSDLYGDDGALTEINPATGEQTAMLLQTSAFAFPAFYGGDILLFEPNQAPPGWSPRVLRFDADDDDGSGVSEVTEIFGKADAPPNIWIRGVASPTCVPLGPEG